MTLLSKAHLKASEMRENGWHVDVNVFPEKLFNFYAHKQQEESVNFWSFNSIAEEFLK